jgi:hypothetical protein
VRIWLSKNPAADGNVGIGLQKSLGILATGMMVTFFMVPDVSFNTSLEIVNDEIEGQGMVKGTETFIV